jgi:hypothetical protein
MPFSTPTVIRRATATWLVGFAILGTGLAPATGDDTPLPPAEPGTEAVAAESLTEDPAASPPNAGPAGGVGEQNPAPRFIHPQPNLRHATARYEPTFAIPAAEIALFELLAAPLPEGGLQLAEGSTLRDLQAWMTRTYRLPLRIDHQALEDAGVDADTILETRHLEGVTLGAALAAVLAGFDLETIVQHESLVLTTREVAESRLLLGVYPLPTQMIARRAERLISTIHDTVAIESWDVVGGIGAIRTVPEANALVIAQTFPVHREIIALLRATFDADLDAGDDRQPAARPIRVHRIHDPAVAQAIATNLVSLCNEALADDADPTAVVKLLGEDRIVVQSASRPFQVYATELIRGLDGVEETDAFGKPLGMGLPF